jgi:hypothetical protein
VSITGGLENQNIVVSGRLRVSRRGVVGRNQSQPQAARILFAVRISDFSRTMSLMNLERGIYSASNWDGQRRSGMNSALRKNLRWAPLARRPLKNLEKSGSLGRLV